MQQWANSHTRSFLQILCWKHHKYFICVLNKHGLWTRAKTFSGTTCQGNHNCWNSKTPQFCSNERNYVDGKDFFRVTNLPDKKSCRQQTLNSWEEIIQKNGRFPDGFEEDRVLGVGVLHLLGFQGFTRLHQPSKYSWMLVSIPKINVCNM